MLAENTSNAGSTWIIIKSNVSRDCLASIRSCAYTITQGEQIATVKFGHFCSGFLIVFFYLAFGRNPFHSLFEWNIEEFVNIFISVFASFVKIIRRLRKIILILLYRETIVGITISE